jgi:hypothetical protein
VPFSIFLSGLFLSEAEGVTQPVDLKEFKPNFTCDMKKVDKRS